MAQEIEYIHSFNPDELEELVSKENETVLKIEEQESEKKELVAEYNEDIGKLKKTLSETAHKISEGSEKRFAQVHRIVNHAKGRVEFFSIDDPEHEERITPSDPEMSIINEQDRQADVFEGQTIPAGEEQGHDPDYVEDTESEETTGNQVIDALKDDGLAEPLDDLPGLDDDSGLKEMESLIPEKTDPAEVPAA